MTASRTWPLPIRKGGNFPAAAQCWEQALAILTELNHPDAAEALARLCHLDADGQCQKSGGERA